jgi:hypothetical protein
MVVPAEVVESLKTDPLNLWLTRNPAAHLNRINWNGDLSKSYFGNGVNRVPLPDSQIMIS